jgi:lambda repressor-like predicted transcriptional regulator
MTMAAKHIPPEMKAKIIALRQAGFSLASIADQTDTSISTVKRHVSATRKGSVKQELIDEARKELLSTLTDDAVKAQLAALVVDDISIAHRIRSNIVSTLEHIENQKPSGLAEAGQTMRALSSAATGLKLTGDALRQSLGVTQRGLHESNTDDLPELIIQDMTGEDIAKIRSRAELLSLGIDDGLGGILPDENDIIVEGFDEPEAA